MSDYLPGIEGRIFIAGTGRSGTSMLHGVLGSHPSVYMVPYESKFIVEADGLEELVSYLTDRFSITHAERALYRFDRLMRSALTGEEPLAIKNWRFDVLIGQDIYYASVNSFIKSLIDYEYEEAVPCDAYSTAFQTHWPSQPLSVRRVLPKMFEQRADAIALGRQFVDGMFGAATLRARKTYWCEKTPSNLLSMAFLWELFPDAVIIHIKRDPRGVFHSLMQQDWAPRSAEATAALLRSLYVRWERFKKSFDFTGRRYLELKIEDLVRDPEPALSAITTLAKLPTWSIDPRILSTEAPDNWRAKMPPAAREVCENALGRFFPLMGYGA
ncbi:MAG TPA: sulfotransferase [Candidatus Sulfotelmatobacter sp.]|nr:sulfotransferase [Candidatus Sulfotelmatobacter sp.]